MPENIELRRARQRRYHQRLRQGRPLAFAQKLPAGYVLVAMPAEVAAQAIKWPTP